jgi:hypothetical protein
MTGPPARMQFTATMQTSSRSMRLLAFGATSDLWPPAPGL